MFEEVPKPPADIFADTDNPENVPPPFRAPSAAPQPVMPSIVTPPQAVVAAPMMSFNWKRLIIIIGLAVVVVVAGLILSKKILSSHPSPNEGLPNVSNAVEEEIEATNEAPAEPAAETNTPSAPPIEEADTDKDGLTDAREAELGTSPNKTDTDDDGLFDREEVEVYKTNPLSPDTDGDGYQDGAEVQGGYNPNGAGKLFELPGSD